MVCNAGYILWHSESNIHLTIFKRDIRGSHKRDLASDQTKYTIFGLATHIYWINKKIYCARIQKEESDSQSEIFTFGFLSKGSKWHYSQITKGRKQAALAQWLAHLTCNEKVTRSTRVRGRSF